MARRSANLPIRLALLASLIVCLSAASSAAARTAYVADFGTETLSAIDLNTNQIGPGVATGSNSGPFSIGIAPDGKTVYVVNYSGGTLGTFDTASKVFLGAPIQITAKSYGFAITPDGRTAYVANNESATVEAIDLGARSRIGAPIAVGDGPDAVTITPDGTRAYVSNGFNDTVSVIDTATNRVVGTPIKVGQGPFQSAITPDGRFLLVPDDDGVTVVDTSANQVVGAPIPIGEKGGVGVAITPDGTRAFVSGEKPNTVTAIDLATGTQIGAPLPIPLEIEFMAITPDGKRLLVEQADTETALGPGQVSIVDTATNQIVGSPIVYGSSDGQVAVVPDQGPVGIVAGKGRARPGVPYLLDGGGSTDSDGVVADWRWAFDDGTTAAGPSVKHVFKKPGEFAVGLTVTDAEGCSAALVFTGQTAYCNASPGASTRKKITVAYPGVKVKCPIGIGPKGCSLQLKAVSRKGKRLVARSAVAKAKLKAGKSAIVSLKPKKKFASKLAGAKTILVSQTLRLGHIEDTTVKRLKVVR